MMNYLRWLWCLLIVCAGLENAQAENWPQWRGPQGTGVSQEADLPIGWGETSGVVWKTALPEWGCSTPAIWDEAIFLTTQHGKSLQLLKIDKSTGQIIWTRQVGQGTAAREAEFGKAKFHRLHNLASPSPVTDGKVVVAHFGNGELAAYDFSGERLWQRNLQADFGRYSIWWGHANSPILYQGLVISVCMQDSLAEKSQPPQAKSYLVAHDLKTGRQRWLTPRVTQASAEQCDSYTTPLLQTVGGRADLIVMGGNQVDAYNPVDGKQRWYLPNIVGGRTITGPTFAHGMVYVTQGMRGPLLAIKIFGRGAGGQGLGSEGQITRRNIRWRFSQGTPDSCCPVVWEDLLFTITDDGIARCLDALSGHLKWKKRLKGNYKASPLAAHGRIYFLNTEGRCTVISASDRYDKLTENTLDDQTLASPAVSEGKIFIRGRRSLYCVGK